MLRRLIILLLIVVDLPVNSYADLKVSSCECADEQTITPNIITNTFM